MHVEVAGVSCIEILPSPTVSVGTTDTITKTIKDNGFAVGMGIVVVLVVLSILVIIR